MITLSEVVEEINKLEGLEGITYSTIQKLAWLYVVRDHIMPRVEEEGKKGAVEVEKAKSDFLILASAKDVSKVYYAVDELVETIQALHPRMYEAFMKKLYDM